MKILLIGPPACGKGTVGRILAKNLKLPFISGGDILRSVSESDPNYKFINNNMKKGVLLPSKLASTYYINRLSNPDCDNGYVLDGWPRSLDNLKYFEPKVDYVFYLNVSEATSVKRVTGRRYCKETGETINVLTLEGAKDVDCKDNFIKRDDDNLETLNKRLEIYKKDTIPVIDYYKNNNSLYEIDAEKNPNEIVNDILKVLKIN